ncbi:MAG TPA: PRC-barrel domain-containing protein, partial [Rubrobacter sp.]|nr:PRC-barrel domain-containing protein [Rubrobacter sp.]
MKREARTDKFTEEVEDRYAGYTVYDRSYEKIGSVDDLFVDENDSPEYIGVKMGFLGTRTSLIPFHIARVNDARQIIEVAADKETLKNGPTFDDDREITPEFENEVYFYYGLERSSTIEQSGTHGAYYAEQSTQTTGVADPTDVSDEDEVRVQRAEEEIRVGTRERKAGSIRV